MNFNSALLSRLFCGCICYCFWYVTRIRLIMRADSCTTVAVNCSDNVPDVTTTVLFLKGIISVVREYIPLKLVP